jgi:hypothetical protein
MIKLTETMQIVAIKKKFTCRDFAAGVFLSEAQNPYPTPLTYCILVEVYLFTQRRGMGGGES